MAGGVIVGPFVVLIVCGGRDYRPSPGDQWWLRGIVQALGVEVIRHGACNCDPSKRGYGKGADFFAGEMARKWGLNEDPCPADWSLGRRGGPVRNRFMLDKHPRPVAIAALLGHDGTKDMVMAARASSVLAIESPRVPAKDRINWQNVPLGMFPDRELARRLGCSHVAVGAARKKRGIDPCKGDR